MVNQKYYISLLSNWVRSVSKEYGIKESTFNNRSKSSMYFKYGTNQTLRISDHIQFAKGVRDIDINICIVFPKNTKDIIVSMEHDTYIYKSISEIKEFLKTTFRYALLFEDRMAYPVIKRANKEIEVIKAKLNKVQAKKGEYASEVNSLKPKLKKLEAYKENSKKLRKEHEDKISKYKDIINSYHANIAEYKKVIKENKVVLNSHESLKTKCENYKLKVKELQQVISNYKENIELLLV